jgi:hypothetical protein
MHFSQCCDHFLNGKVFFGPGPVDPLPLRLELLPGPGQDRQLPLQRGEQENCVEARSGEWGSWGGGGGAAGCALWLGTFWVVWTGALFQRNIHSSGPRSGLF